MKNIETVEWTPLCISDEDLSQLPPCQFYACEYDVLKNDADIMHARLQKLNKKTDLTLWKGNLLFSSSTIFDSRHFTMENWFLQLKL